MRYLDRKGLSSRDNPAYIKSLHLEYDEEVEQGFLPLPGDVIITGPFSAKEWSWLPKQVHIEIVPDGGEILRQDPLKYALRKEGLSDAVVTSYLKAPPSDRAKFKSNYESAAAWSNNHTVDLSLGSAFAPYQLVTDPDYAIHIINSLRGNLFAIDYETRADGSIHGVALANHNMSWYLWGDAMKAYPLVVELLQTTPWIAHGAKFEYKTTARAAHIDPTDLCHAYCTQVLNWCITSTPGVSRLKHLVKTRLKRDVLTYDDVMQGRDIDSVSPDEVARYSAAGDARNTYDLFPILKQEAIEAGVWHVYNDIERPLTPVLAEIELNGIEIDLDVLSELTTMYVRRRSLLATALSSMGLNDTAPDAVADWLYKDLGLPILAMTDTGSRGSVDANVLRELVDLTKSQQVATYLHWKEMEGNISKFMIPTIRRRSNLIHPNFQQTSTETGRLSSTDPNFQQMPARRYPEIRKMVVAREGDVFFSADYSSQEPRIVAVASQDPNMIEDFRLGLDPYISLGRRIGADVSRTEMKIAYLAWLYGDYTEYTQDLDRAHPAFVRWREGILQRTRETGYAYSLEGRRRYLPRIWSKDPKISRKAEREASNMPIQGTAADITKLAMPPVLALLKQAKRFPTMAPIHDELVGTMPERYAEEMKREVSALMAKAYSRVELTADAQYGRSWYDAKG